MNRIIVLLLPALLLSACFDKLDLSGICRPGDPACAELDYDSDGVINALDNCPSIPNSNQADGDQDGTGDACEDLVIVDPDSCTGDRCLTFEHFEVYSDDNSDGVINKGETVRIKVYLKNQSSRRIGDLSGSLSSSDTLVSISEPGVANWGSLDGGREDYGNVQGGYSYSFEFSVDPGAPAGHQIPFSLAMSDSAGNSWSLSFNAVVDVLDAGLLVGRVEIYSDDNSDGAINKGETVRIKVFLRNTGQSDILDLSAVVSSSDQYVTLSYPDSANWGNLVAAEEDYGNISGGYSYSYEFTVDPATPDDHLMEFSLAATDQHQNTWTLPFSLTVVDLAARLEVSRVEIYSDDNSDKAINKGETVRLKVFLRNTGESDILDLSALLSTNDPYVSVSYPDSANWGNLVSGEEDYGNISGGYSYSFQIEVDPATPDDHVIQFGLAAADEHDNTWQLSFQQTVQDLAAQLVFSRVEIYSDDNSNDLAEAGETVRIKVYLRNTGTSDALDVGAVLSAGDSLSTISYPDSAGFGNMVAGEEDYGNISGGYSYSYQLDVSAQATAGQNMNFSLAISDEFSNTWSDSFQIQVY